MDLFTKCLHRKELSLSMHTSIIILIYKKIDRKQIKNYQPIFLLCVDYKIIAKTMAKKMNNVMHKVCFGW